MLLLLTGASGVGKSTVLGALQQREWSRPIQLIEFDSIGVPADADTGWRHWAIEQWVGRAVAAQSENVDILLCGQVPLGELLASPSADLLGGIAVCVLHCSPEVRRMRLRGRGEPEETLIHHLRFGEWFHRHSIDPAHAPEVIRVDSPVPMRWERWDGWTRGDRRWAPEVIDTDALTPEGAVDAVAGWVRDVLDGRTQVTRVGDDLI